jgi:hypothetical protein
MPVGIALGRFSLGMPSATKGEPKIQLVQDAALRNVAAGERSVAGAG